MFDGSLCGKLLAVAVLKVKLALEAQGAACRVHRMIGCGLRGRGCMVGG